MHTPKSLTGHEPRVFAERVMRVDSVLLGSRELSHSRVWFELDHRGPSCLGELKPASAANYTASLHPLWVTYHCFPDTLERVVKYDQEAFTSRVSSQSV